MHPNSHPPPNKNNDYIHISKDSKGIFQLVYQKLIKQALSLYSKYGMTVKGMYLPVLVKIKQVINKPHDVEMIKVQKE